MFSAIRNRRNVKSKNCISLRVNSFSARIVVVAVATLAFLFHSDLISAQDGATIFKQNCAACHKTDDSRLVGPGLKGINQKRSADWLVKWIKDSPAMIAGGDADAVAIYNEYNQASMPAVALDEAQIRLVLAWIDDVNSTDGAVATDVAAPPVVVAPKAPEPPMSIQKKLSYGILGFIIAVFIVILFFTIMRTRNLLGASGQALARQKKAINPVQTFIIMAAVAIALIYLLSNVLATNSAMNFIFFGAFPYMCLAVFLIGTIYRYRMSGFKVSSLSSQFLEGRGLFWASQPFHWGIMILFFGHLIAFLFPRTLLAFNGEPVRLIILEVASFVFALAALMGLFLFIRRRLTNKRISVVSNRMDMLVYIVLLVQIISGLGVAFFVRWGSSWFAAVLTPYLRSLFALNPEVDAVSAMPFLVQLHIISAWAIIGIIPFTRFVHFLVAPVDYIWRKYQVVIWNWDRRRIRTSKSHFPGQKTRNH